MFGRWVRGGDSFCQMSPRGSFDFVYKSLVYCHISHAYISVVVFYLMLLLLTAVLSPPQRQVCHFRASVSWPFPDSR